MYYYAVTTSRRKLISTCQQLTTTINKIQSVPNQTNSVIINEFNQYMKDNDSSVHHQNNNLKVVIAFANFLGPSITFYEIKKKQQILAFLNTKIKDLNHDPEKRWITTWNHYLYRIRLFFRWLYNYRSKEYYYLIQSRKFGLTLYYHIIIEQNMCLQLTSRVLIVCMMLNKY